MVGTVGTFQNSSFVKRCFSGAGPRGLSALLEDYKKLLEVPCLGQSCGLAVDWPRNATEIPDVSRHVETSQAPHSPHNRKMIKHALGSLGTHALLRDYTPPCLPVSCWTISNT